LRNAGIEGQVRGISARHCRNDFYLTGPSERMIAEMVGWEAALDKIIRRHACREAALKDTIRLLDEAGKRT